jgi:hypothetical protein
LGQTRREIFLQAGLDSQMTDLPVQAKSVLGAKVRDEVSFDTDPNSLHFRQSLAGAVSGPLSFKRANVAFQHL